MSRLKLQLAPNVRELSRIRPELRAYLCEQISDEVMFTVEFALEEVFTNIVRHGYAEVDPGESIQLEVGLVGDQVLLQLDDRGTDYDPNFHPPAAPPETLADAADGGRGIDLVRRLADRIDYRSQAGVNRLEMWLPTQGSGPE